MGQILLAAKQHFTKNPAHRAVVRPFMAGFDISRALSGAQPRNTIFFLKPERPIAEFLGIERELLLLYSEHEDFQARTLALHDEVIAQHRDRLDPMGSVIVSAAKNVRQYLEDALSKEPERAPIVALNTDDLRAITDLNGLRTAFASQFYTRDLFGYESPLTKDTVFFGRKDVVPELIDRFRSGQNTGLFGLRRIGKTSVLLAVKRRCEEERIGAVTYLDLSNPSRWKLRGRDLLMTIAREIAALVPSDLLEPSRVRAYRQPYSEEQAAARFREDIAYLSSVLPGKRILVALDEIEYVTADTSPAEHWNSDFLSFWQSMRSVHQELGGSLCYLLAGVNPHALEMPRVSNRWDDPLFSTVRVRYLQPFEHATVREMVRKLARFSGLSVEEELYSVLTEDFGGHPYLIRQACSLLVEKIRERPAELRLSQYRAERESIGRRLEQNVKQILSVLESFYPDEFEGIRRLARGEGEQYLEAARASGSFVDHMEGYGLVSTQGGSPRVRIGVVREYLAKLPAPRDRRLAEPDDPTDILVEISRRRNALEKALRKFIGDGLEFAHGTKAGSKALGALPSARRDLLTHYGFAEMWTEMYFDELRLILGAEWAAFEPRFRPFEKAEVDLWMRHINRSRADAHADEIGPDDLAYLRVCFGHLENVLERYL